MTTATRRAAAMGAAMAAGVLVTAALASLAHAQNTFVARTDRTTGTLGETLTYEVTLSLTEGQAQGYRPPDFKGFRVQGEYPSHSTQVQMGGGATIMRSIYSWRYELAPSESGRLTIGPARVRVGGRELKTAPVGILV